MSGRGGAGAGGGASGGASGSPEKRRVEFDAEQSPAQRGRPGADDGRELEAREREARCSREVRERELARALEREREVREREREERERRRAARPPAYRTAWLNTTAPA